MICSRSSIQPNKSIMQIGLGELLVSDLEEN